MKQEQPERAGGKPERIRIQPREIDVPPNNPFENDRLGRKEPAEILTHLLSSLEGPCVLAVDAAWGNGKTTFLRIWAQYLRNEKFPVVEFNAWETDFSGDPFVALSTELTEGLKGIRRDNDTPLEQKIDETEAQAKEVLRRAVPGLIRVATAGILDVGPLVEKEVGQALASYADTRISEYQEAQKSVKAFREALQNMAETLSESHQHRPLVVMVDELDRCRPSYAVELLEVAKHLFSVDHIVFILAVNRSELAHAIRALYGDGFDAEGYLRRFFDVDFVLPNPERNDFIGDRLSAIQIDKYFERTQDQLAGQQSHIVRHLLCGFFGTPDLSLRRIAQAIHRLGLVLASLRSGEWAFIITATVVLILRTINADLYHRFVRGGISDLELVDTVFTRPEAKALQQTQQGELFEVIIIIAAQERRGFSPLAQLPPDSSPLVDRYRDQTEKLLPDDPAREHAANVIKRVEKLQRAISTTESGRMGFEESVQRLELLSAHLKDEVSRV